MTKLVCQTCIGAMCLLRGDSHRDLSDQSVCTDTLTWLLVSNECTVSILCQCCDLTSCNTTRMFVRKTSCFKKDKKLDEMQFAYIKLAKADRQRKFGSQECIGLDDCSIMKFRAPSEYIQPQQMYNNTPSLSFTSYCYAEKLNCLHSKLVDLNLPI